MFPLQESNKARKREKKLRNHFILPYRIRLLCVVNFDSLVLPHHHQIGECCLNLTMITAAVWSTIRMERERNREKKERNWKFFNFIMFSLDLEPLHYRHYPRSSNNERSEWGEWKQDWCENMNFLTIHFRWCFSLLVTFSCPISSRR